MVLPPPLCPAAAAMPSSSHRGPNGGVGGAALELLPTSTELPPGAYSAERGLSEGGMNKDRTPDLGTGGLNIDVALAEGKMEVGVRNGADSEGGVHVELGVTTDAGREGVVEPWM